MHNHENINKNVTCVKARYTVYDKVTPCNPIEYYYFRKIITRAEKGAKYVNQYNVRRRALQKTKGNLERPHMWLPVYLHCPWFFGLKKQFQFLLETFKLRQEPLQCNNPVQMFPEELCRN